MWNRWGEEVTHSAAENTRVTCFHVFYFGGSKLPNGAYAKPLIDQVPEILQVQAGWNRRGVSIDMSRAYFDQNHSCRRRIDKAPHMKSLYNNLQPNCRVGLTIKGQSIRIEPRSEHFSFASKTPTANVGMEHKASVV